uniref:Uncharacterized protein n=1 Tax=Arundo donax TaxID=35708 RepID=A0A0A9GCC1_ARUDO
MIVLGVLFGMTTASGSSATGIGQQWSGFDERPIESNT